MTCKACICLLLFHCKFCQQQYYLVKIGEELQPRGDSCAFFTYILQCQNNWWVLIVLHHQHHQPMIIMHVVINMIQLSSDEFPELLRGSIRQNQEGRFFEDFYRFYSDGWLIHFTSGGVCYGFFSLYIFICLGLLLRMRGVMSGRHCWSL